MKKLFRFLICAMPAALYFSYFPLIHFGENESMNFEISLPLIWLVAFDLTTALMSFREKDFWRGIIKHWYWLLLPIWLSLSAIWSLNVVRGLITAIILWLIYLAIYGFYYYKNLFKKECRTKFWQVFYGSTIIVCAWCFVQCILDLAGISREYTLMCAGCTYSMFGFPHPNGFAIEPQFMGNLLLAPIITLVYFIIEGGAFAGFKKVASAQKTTSAQKTNVSAIIANHRTAAKLTLLFLFLATLFLTFSRGAIYAFTVSIIFMSTFVIVREQKITRKKVAGRVGLTWLITVIAFLFTLNLQGIMSATSPTSDTYQDGVAKVLNHLSLGKIDIRTSEKENSDEFNTSDEYTQSDDYRQSNEYSKEDKAEESSATQKAVFDGYVAESTNARLYLSDAAMQSWNKDTRTMLFGVGLGGAGQAIFANGFVLNPKEIVQNQYVSLLLESGLAGVALLIFTLGLILRLIWKKCNILSPMLLAQIVAYGVTLCFFAGLANALQIYLLTGWLIVFVLLFQEAKPNKSETID